MTKYVAIISFFVFIIALNQCGFTLRSNEVISSRFNSIQLNLQPPNSELSRLLRRRLDIAGVETQLLTTNSPNINQPILVISDEQMTSRPVTFNPRARTAQQEMRLSITILFEQGEQMLIRPETLFVERTYFEDVENIAGNQEEVVIIRAEMRGELVNQIMRRLEAASN
ncbi:MAG: LPS assembly lipoprotein LptE [Pseudomonadota bacterium]|nr:LPS assembly lipoprotein LptE [Pseudomonadota bacterium]MED6332996.1 LPS assembly lipoprotein LptE [Pseudomonadota bacterium]MEE3239157.1 LPS assembly lipoprotein LptE [Pseudomonadota bacterium]MEE3300432.1 LPS assembly lipoprotein LptE [Pseudomonadota bacterium]|tara:strand:- start:654 stop:1160 length:507 start_codon:yes stop_codon:yes gene_type:complete